MKRDDCTGLAFGGNKERKAEFVMADALKRKADVVVTTGPVQSNHARATAAAARKVGLRVVLVLKGKEPQEYDGNLLLDNLLGADVRYVDAGKSDVNSEMGKIAEELEGEGHTPYIIPGGASYSVGAVAYVNAMLELVTQSKKNGIKIDFLVHATGSGGTQAGLVLANTALDLGIDILGPDRRRDT
jgi:L-cysteate sulfo-lyase